MKEEIKKIKELKSRKNIMKKTEEYSKELDEMIAYDDGYSEAIDDIIKLLTNK